MLHSRTYQYANASVHVFSDSVLCLEKMGHNPVESWKKQIQWYSESNHFSELNRIDGKPIEFEWKIFPGFTTLNEIQKMMGEVQCDPADFKGRIISMSMFNDIAWDAKGNEELRENNSKRVEEHARRFPRGDWSFLGLGSEKKWYATYNSKPNGCWDRIAEKIMQYFSKIWSPNIPLFQCLGERTIKKQRRRKDNNSFHSK